MHVHPSGRSRAVCFALALALLAQALPVARAALAAPAAACGVLVSTIGTDTPTCGLSADSPCRTINYGIQRAVAEGGSCVFVQVGTYNEVLVLVSGVDVTGGFGASWAPGTYDQPGHEVRVVGGLDAASGGTNEYLTVRAHSLFAPARLAELILQGPNAAGTSGVTGRSSCVVHASANLTLDHVLLQAGHGAPGAPGSDGLDATSLVRALSGGAGGSAVEQLDCNGSSHGAGGPAGTNTCTSSPGTRPMNGGPGGPGGEMDTSCPFSLTATSGDPGGSAAYVSGVAGLGGPGGPANSGACNSGDGTPGGNGNPGIFMNGAGGAGGAGGVLAGGFWYGASGLYGGTGENGSGGGGGGGGGGCDSGTDSWGAGGGGGGAGGCAARGGGTSGGGGGGSFAVVVVGGAIVNLNNCTIERGNGGAGGRGGDGGQGQPGGFGGPGGAHLSASAAGLGGQGAHGGHGGGGGGGAGGHSYAILRTNGSTVNTSGLLVAGGAAGPGGNGGVSAPGAPLADDDGNDGASGFPGGLGTTLVVAGAEPALAARPASGAGSVACNISCVLDAPAPNSAMPLSFAGVSPNPVAGVSLVRFGLPEESHVTIEVFDLVGRRVHTLANGTFPAGAHAVRWDGALDDGARAAAGVYALRFSALGRTLTRTAVVMK